MAEPDSMYFQRKLSALRYSQPASTNNSLGMIASDSCAFGLTPSKPVLWLMFNLLVMWSPPSLSRRYSVHAHKVLPILCQVSQPNRKRGRELSGVLPEFLEEQAAPQHALPNVHTWEELPSPPFKETSR